MLGRGVVGHAASSVCEHILKCGLKGVVGMDWRGEGGIYACGIHGLE
jgi:hypothetical protein